MTDTHQPRPRHRIHFVIDLSTDHHHHTLTSHALRWLDQLAHHLATRPGIHTPEPIRIDINGTQHHAPHHQP